MAGPRVESPETVASATRQDVEGLLHRLLHTGSLQGFPKRPEHRDILLAVAAMTLIRRRPYAEPEVNEVLLEWLASVRGAIDHVTLRRRMVDCGFLRRTRDGSRYFLDYGRVAGILGNPAIEIDAAVILDNVLRERGARKRVYTKDSLG